MARSRTPAKNLVWSEEEKNQALQHALGSRSLLIPDDNFYTSFLTKDDLLEMAQKIMRHLDIRSKKIHFSFSHGTTEKGSCEVAKTIAHIRIPVRYMGRPYEGTGVLTHLLCHYLMIQKGIVLPEDSENEKLVDSASIAAGLGILILNGLPGSSWHYLVGNTLKTNLEHQETLGSLGYYSPASYGALLHSYLTSHHIDEPEASASLLPWALPLVYGPKATRPHKPLFVTRAESYLHHSVRQFWVSVGLVASLIAFVGYIWIQRPPVLSDELRTQQQKVQQLESSYNGCAERVSKQETDYRDLDQASQRFIDGERSECKSLENRYNYEVSIYNELLKRYDTTN